MAGKSIAVVVTARQRNMLEALVRAKLTPQQLAQRCRIVLMSAEERRNTHQADELGVDRQRVRRWRHRWAAAEQVLSDAEAEGATDKDLETLVLRVLADNARSGTPPKFTPEQVASIIALACEPPEDSGVPVSHWTPPELAREAVRRGIVEGISPRQIDRFLARRSSGHTRASTGSRRKTNWKLPNNTRQMSRRSARRT
jgi:putative transposase